MASLLEQALSSMKKKKKKESKKPDALVLAVREFMEAKTEEEKADALRGCFELAQLEKE